VLVLAAAAIRADPSLRVGQHGWIALFALVDGAVSRLLAEGLVRTGWFGVGDD